MKFLNKLTNFKLLYSLCYIGTAIFVLPMKKTRARHVRPYLALVFLLTFFYTIQSIICVVYWPLFLFCNSTVLWSCLRLNYLISVLCSNIHPIKIKAIKESPKLKYASVGIWNSCPFKGPVAPNKLSLIQP